MKLKYVIELRTAVFVHLVIICCLKVPSYCDWGEIIKPINDSNAVVMNPFYIGVYTFKALI